MTDTFDAVLAEMRALAQRRREDDSDITSYEVEDFATSLAAAHAAEVAERDARIAELEADKKAMFIRAREWATRSGEQEQRAEAAERDARELRAILHEAVGDDAKEWESGDGWPMGRFLVPALAGDYATAAHEFAAYNAERAAIATTEQADED